MTDAKTRSLVVMLREAATSAQGYLNETARACGIDPRMQIVCEGRMEAGHRVYGTETIDAQSEALEELADAINYAAIARMHGAWTWRWRVAGWLVGVAWRVMR